VGKEGEKEYGVLVFIDVSPITWDAYILCILQLVGSWVLTNHN